MVFILLIERLLMFSFAQDSKLCTSSQITMPASFLVSNEDMMHMDVVQISFFLLDSDLAVASDHMSRGRLDA